MNLFFQGSLISAVLLSALTVRGQNQVITNSSTYQLPVVTVYGAEPGESPGVTEPANAVTVLSGEQVRPGGITTTRELGTYLPNVTVFDANNDRTPKFSIRGMRENNFAAGDPAVGFYVDDVPYTDLNSRGVALFDVERIEFLRGPQGTLFGANGPGGVINVVTRQPGDQWEGNAGISYGTYEAQSYEMSVRGPIIAETLSIGVAGIYSKRDGFVENLFNGSHPDDKKTLAGRLQVGWTPTETLQFSLTLHGQSFDDGFVPTYYSAVDESPFDVKRDFNGFVDTDQWGVALKGSFDNDIVKVTSVSSYRNWEQDLEQDFDFSPMPGRIGFNYPELEQWTQEFRVQSRDETAPLKWLGGAYFSHAASRQNSGSVEMFPLPSVPLPPPNTFRTLADADADTYAVFGHGVYTVCENFDLVAGLRFTYDDRSMDRVLQLENSFVPTSPISGFNASESFTDLSPKFGSVYRVTDQFELYGSVSRGYQSGGFNAANDTANDARFGSSHSWHYEVGAKSRFWEDRITANGALFYTDSENYQVYRTNPMNPSQAYIVNAESVQSFGAEFDVVVQPVNGFEVSAAIGVTEAEFDDFTDTTSGTRFDGNDVNFVPQFTGNVAVQYTFPFNLYARVEVQAVGNYYLDEANTAEQKTYGLLNARIGYRHEYFEVYVFGRNLLDKEYTNNALDLRNAFQPDLLVRQPGDPLVAGIALTAGF
jgi:iron complex outermembrane receptor protein